MEMIERRKDKVEIKIHTAKPGVIIGKGGEGNIDLLRKLAINDMEVHTISDITLDGRRISSTWIRNAINEGDMNMVSTLLGGIKELNDKECY